MKYFILLSGALLMFFGTFAQDVTPTISPEFFSADQEITISYDVTGTSLSSLDEAWIWLWLPDQTNVDVASNVNPANSDTDATDAAKFTKTENGGQVIFTLSLTLTDFTGLAKDDINQVGMLIKGNDWADGQSNDYVTSVTTEFTLQLDQPSSDFGFHQSGDVIDVLVKASEAADIDLYLDDAVIHSETASTSLEFEHTVVDDGNVHVLKAIATNGSETDEVSYSYTLTPNPPNESVPVGNIDGVNYGSDATAVTLVFTAPNKENVFVIGDFNDWTLNQDYLMNKDGEKFWLTITGLEAGKEYIFQYLVDGELRIADPYTDKISDPWDDKYIDEETYPGLIEYPVGKTEYRASVLQTNQQAYSWTNESFDAPAKENLMIYEILVRDFYETHTFKDIEDKLD